MRKRLIDDGYDDEEPASKRISVHQIPSTPPLPISCDNFLTSQSCFHNVPSYYHGNQFGWFCGIPNSCFPSSPLAQRTELNQPTLSTANNPTLFTNIPNAIGAPSSQDSDNFHRTRLESASEIKNDTSKKESNILHAISPSAKCSGNIFKTTSSSLLQQIQLKTFAEISNADGRSAQIVKSRKRKAPIKVPEEEKDEEYKAKRAKNNESSRRSRMKRAVREICTQSEIDEMRYALKLCEERLKYTMSVIKHLYNDERRYQEFVTLLNSIDVQPIAA